MKSKQFNLLWSLSFLRVCVSGYHYHGMSPKRVLILLLPSAINLGWTLIFIYLFTANLFGRLYLWFVSVTTFLGSTSSADTVEENSLSCYSRETFFSIQPNIHINLTFFLITSLHRPLLTYVRMSELYVKKNEELLFLLQQYKLKKFQ